MRLVIFPGLIDRTWPSPNATFSTPPACRLFGSVGRWLVQAVVQFVPVVPPVPWSHSPSCGQYNPAAQVAAASRFGTDGLKKRKLVSRFRGNDRLGGSRRI